jgi:hypothetical protein
VKKLLSPRTAGFALVALLCVVMLFQLLMASGLILPGESWLLRISSLIVSLVLFFGILVVLEKLGLIRLLRQHRVINAILWVSGGFLFLSAVATFLLPGGFALLWLAVLSLAGSGLSWIVARAPFTGKS